MPRIFLHHLMHVWITPLILLGIAHRSHAQEYVEKRFSVAESLNIHYGTDVSFAGFETDLLMDVYTPANDDPPACGRPLLLMVHGGAWTAGDKRDGYALTIARDFAARGYTTASVNYRLGFFHTEKFINCNVPDWNCFNATDSTEWYRANHRAVQDVYGALRYLINRADTYEIDPDKVFVVGESAGAFIALSFGLTDEAGEVNTAITGEMPDVPVPNDLYESPCVQKYDLAPSNDAMALSRPDLGPITGRLNLPAAVPFRLRGIGSFYGGLFDNLLKTNATDPPRLYFYHQPCDLIVPYGKARLLAGYVSCLSGFPANCGNIINRPVVYGGKAMESLITELAAQSISTNPYFFDDTSFNYNCLQQAAEPSLSCHAIDNYALRTHNMAIYFAEAIPACEPSAVVDGDRHSDHLFYDPPQRSIRTDSGIWKNGRLLIFDVRGRQILARNVNPFDGPMDVSELIPGFYTAVHINEEASISLRFIR